MIHHSTSRPDRRCVSLALWPSATVGPLRVAARLPVDGRRHQALLPTTRPANDPVFSIEEAIRHYVDSQPPQLYRGGA
jgi:hypothetical protein